MFDTAMRKIRIKSSIKGSSSRNLLWVFFQLTYSLGNCGLYRANTTGFEENLKTANVAYSWV